MQAGLVSVILPTFNRRETLARSIRSVLQQSYENLELLVVDDGSTDDTADVVSQFRDPRLKYIPLADNMGASRARNVGLSHCTGKYIAFQDSDDEWLGDKLMSQVKAAEQSGQKDVAVFHIKIIYGIDNDLRYGQHNLSCVPILPDGLSQRDFQQLIKTRNVVSPQTLLFTRDTLERIGKFDEALANSVDWDFAIRLIHNTHTIFLDEPLVMTYTQTDSISRLRRRSVRSRLRIVQKLARQYEVDAPVMARHFGTLGMTISKFGKPKGGRRLLRRAVRLDPTNGKNWARLAATECLVLALPVTSRLGWRVWR
jgi:glycosyltransferase involved in cell wall biosynthesis